MKVDALESQIETLCKRQQGIQNQLFVNQARIHKLQSE